MLRRSKFFLESPWAPGHWPFHVCIDAHGQRVGIIHLSTTWTRFHSEWVNDVKTALWNLPAPQRQCICSFGSRLTVHRRNTVHETFPVSKRQSSNHLPSIQSGQYLFSRWWLSFNPSERYERQIGSFTPNFGMKIKRNIWVVTTNRSGFTSHRSFGPTTPTATICKCHNSIIQVAEKVLKQQNQLLQLLWLFFRGHCITFILEVEHKWRNIGSYYEVVCFACLSSTFDQ